MPGPTLQLISWSVGDIETTDGVTGVSVLTGAWVSAIVEVGGLGGIGVSVTGRAAAIVSVGFTERGTLGLAIGAGVFTARANGEHAVKTTIIAMTGCQKWG
jgi:hypothetical protein